MNLFPLIILFIVGANIVKGIREQAKKQQQMGGQQPGKQPPRLFETKDGTPPAVVQHPSQRQKQAADTGKIPPVFGTGPRGTVFDQWFAEGQQEKGVAWEAQRDEVAEFLGIKSKPVPVVPPPMPVAEEVKLEPILEEVRRPTIPVARRKREPVRKKAAQIMPTGVFGEMGDVRRGIIMSEILGPPKGLQ
jgi:hypothetical protein